VTGTAFAQADDTLARIKSSGTVNLGMRDSSGLGFTIGGGTYVGFHTEMADRIVDDLKKLVGTDLKINYQVITSQNRIPLLTNGTIDFECGSTTNNATRAKDVAFAVTTFLEEVRIATQGNSGINSVADLNGKTVAVTNRVFLIDVGGRILEDCDKEDFFAHPENRQDRTKDFLNKILHN